MRERRGFGATVLTRLDMFGAVPRLVVRGQGQVTSPLGGLFSLCLMLVVLIEMVPRFVMMVSNDIIAITREEFWDEDAIMDLSDQHLVIGATWKNDAKAQQYGYWYGT